MKIKSCKKIDGVMFAKFDNDGNLVLDSKKVRFIIEKKTKFIFHNEHWFFVEDILDALKIRRSALDEISYENYQTYEIEIDGVAEYINLINFDGVRHLILLRQEDTEAFESFVDEIIKIIEE